MRNKFFGLLFAFSAPTIAAPAPAQVFWLPPDFSGPVLASYEDGMGFPLPGATAVEQKAAIIWNMRSGLNVAALQCNFDPTLRTLENYNAVLSNHSTELNGAFKTLTTYFKRVNKTPQAGQKALDTFGTRTYSSFSTVGAQLGFCTAAARVSRIALFTPKGSFVTFSEEHLRELRNSLKTQGEQQFRRNPYAIQTVKLPNFDKRCWKGDKYQAKCGTF